MSADNHPSIESPRQKKEPIYFKFYKTPEAGDIESGRTNKLTFTPLHNPYFLTTPSRKVSRNRELERPSKTNEANKKLINLSKMVFEHIQRYPETSGNTITEELQRYFRDQGEEADFKNIQRRVYDALNVMEALGLVLKERNRIQYLDSKVYQGKERKQKQLENERRKKRQENQRQLLMRYRELDIIKKKTEVIQFKLDQLKQTAARNFKRRERVHPVINLPFICIASSDPLPLLKNQEGTTLCVKIPDQTQIKIETELAFVNRLNIREAMRDPKSRSTLKKKALPPLDQTNQLVDPLLSEAPTPIVEVRQVSINLLGSDKTQSLQAFSPYPGHPGPLGTPSPGLLAQREQDKSQGISEQEKKDREYYKNRRLLMNDIFGKKQLRDEEGNKYTQEYKVKRIIKEMYPPPEDEAELDNLIRVNPAHALLQSPAMAQIVNEIQRKYSVREAKETNKLKLNKTGTEIGSFKKAVEKLNKMTENLQ